jgi:hypothetical protein
MNKYGRIYPPEPLPSVPITPTPPTDATATLRLEITRLNISLNFYRELAEAKQGSAAGEVVRLRLDKMWLRQYVVHLLCRIHTTKIETERTIAHLEARLQMAESCSRRQSGASGLLLARIAELENERALRRAKI